MKKSLLVLLFAALVAFTPVAAMADSIGTLTGTCLTNWNVSQLNTAGASLCYTYSGGTLTINGISSGTASNTLKTVSEAGTNGLSFSSATAQNNWSLGTSGSYQIDGFGTFTWDLNHSNSDPNFLTGNLATGITGAFSNNSGGNDIVFHVQFNGDCSGFVGGGSTSNAVSSNTGCGTNSTPEPASLALLASGLLALGGLVRRRK